MSRENEQVACDNPQTFLGAGRRDPFSTCPVVCGQWEDSMIDHCKLVLVWERSFVHLP
jgi:hypothetical protein